MLGGVGGFMRYHFFMVACALVAFAGSVGANAQTLTSGYGSRSDPFNGKRAKHSGVDIAAKTGTPVYATGDGYIGRSRWAGGYGNLVEINHGGGYQTRFGHLSQRLVTEGQYVRRGTLIGRIGSTGRSTGPHLHYEVRVNGLAVDPTPYIRGFKGRITQHNVGVGGPAEDR